jgi:hypothetical protein
MADAEDLVTPMTAWLRAATGTQELRPIQAAGLAELAEYSGLFLAARVGAGKTLALGLGATVVNAQRPLLINPAADVSDKTEEYRILRKHWQIRSDLKIISYDKLSRAQKCSTHGDKPCDCERPTFLDLYRPDYIGCDECQALRYPRDAACARKFARYAASAHGQKCAFAFATGTPARSTLIDYCHMLVWAFRENAPVPLEPEIQEEWAQLIDGFQPGKPSKQPRQLSYSILHPHLGGHIDNEETAQTAFADRLEQTPGVIISRDLFTEQQLTISPLHWPTPDSMTDDWQQLRKLWTLPDGWLLEDKTIGVWQAAQQMALGFYYTADPWPPTDWAEAHSAWAKFCRKVLEGSDTLDSEYQVKQACRAGTLPSFALDEWECMATRAPIFVRNTVPVWLSTHAIEAAAAWGHAHGTEGAIIWSSYRAFGQALAERTGWPYYGAKGRNASGQSVNKSTAPIIIASTRSCTTSRNLQKNVGPGGRGYRNNLFTTPPQKAVDWEQRIGRTHREGASGAVHVDYVCGCLENFVALHVGLGYAQRAEQIERQPQKILNCEYKLPRPEWAVGPAYGEKTE